MRGRVPKALRYGLRATLWGCGRAKVLAGRRCRPRRVRVACAQEQRERDGMAAGLVGRGGAEARGREGDALRLTRRRRVPGETGVVGAAAACGARACAR